MKSTYVGDALLFLPGAPASSGSILICDGKIAQVNPELESLPVSCQRVDGGGRRLTAGLVDIHTHGIHAYSYERDPQSLINGAAQLARYGTTCILPTIYKLLDGSDLLRLEKLAGAIEQGLHVKVPGFHFEGPFLAIAGAGAPTLPGDVGLLEELLAAAKGHVCAMSVSPECSNVVPVIERLRERNIAVFLTHTRASVEQTRMAIDAGARHATHFYDVFPIPEELEPGVRPVGAVETILADSRCTVDFICDGVHVHPMAIRAALAAKGPSGIVAITDSNIGAGLSDGSYATPWGYRVKVTSSDAARVDDLSHPLHGLLSGSSLTMDRAIEFLRHWLPLDEHKIWAMGTTNPAHAAGLPGAGALRLGADADFVIWNENDGQLSAAQTWIKGVCVFDAENVPDSTSNSEPHGQLISV